MPPHVTVEQVKNYLAAILKRGSRGSVGHVALVQGYGELTVLVVTGAGFGLACNVLRMRFAVHETQRGQQVPGDPTLKSAAP